MGRPMKMAKLDKAPYYWWYEYLKRHDEYRLCCKQKGRGQFNKLYKDFGNVHNQSFDEWWERHQGLFEKPEPFVIHHLESKAEYEWCDFDTTMFMGVNLLVPKRTLLLEFNRLLNKHHPGGRGRPDWDDSMATYSLEARPDVRVLKKTLEVYDFRKANEQLTLWEIGDQLKINPSHSTTGKVAAGRTPFVVQRKNVGSAVSRYLRHADALISNTGNGIFPLDRRSSKVAWKLSPDYSPD